MPESRLPQTSQVAPHARLEATVARHLAHRWRAPIRDYSRQAFETLAGDIDKSAVRLARAPKLPENARIVRAELSDFWRLAHAAAWRVRHHYLLYPNPWPKPAHLQRRWHGHPVFPQLLALGGRLELRSNFGLYVEEFSRALKLAGVVDVKVVSFPVEHAISPFERKYARSGHELFQLTAQLE